MMSRFNRPARMLCCFGIFASLFGCAPESIGDGEAIGSSSDAIINGTAMTAADEETWGMVRINGGSCSGALFRNQWVLTASHCFDGGLDNPGNYQVSMNTQTVRADAIIPHSTYDVALVHLATPLSRNGSSTTGRGRSTAATRRGRPCAASASGGPRSPAEADRSSRRSCRSRRSPPSGTR